LAQRLTGRFAASAAAQGRAIVIQRPPGLVLEVDEAALERAVGNLIANALQHGTGDVTIDMSATAPQLRVRDEGDGAAAAGDLFRRFHRGPARRTEGSGLGLAIVAAVAEAHGGEAGVTGADGRFTAWIALPIRDARDAARARR
jgi:two-component system OmpR family sensor kinase